MGKSIYNLPKLVCLLHMESKESEVFKSVGKGANSSEPSQNTKQTFFLPGDVKESKQKLSVKQIILALLRERAWKQTQLADKIGMSRQGLNNYISGRWFCPTQIKIRIAQALGVDSSVIWDLEANK